MGTSESASWLAESMMPLTVFGDRLVLQRHGDSASWSYDGQRVVVEVRPSGALAAKYLERPALDEVSARAAGGVYRNAGSDYRTTPEGCGRMVADMLAFFSGAREPRFTFIDAYVLDN